MNIPFLDLGMAYQEISSEIDSAVAQVLSSGWYIGGQEVSSFEEQWGAYCGADHYIGTGNGLDALVLALRACGIGPGDGVIVPSHTFIATWLAVSAVGAIIQPVEPDPNTFNIDPTRIEAAITPKTRAIIPVHLYGQPVDLDPILSIAKSHNLIVIEDAAQAHGACYKGVRIGAHSHAVCWSFYPGKNLGALGDAGAVTTNDPDISASVRRFGNHGSDTKYVHVEKGVNSRMDPVQAAVLKIKLRYLDVWNKRRGSIAQVYAQYIDIADIVKPTVPPWAEPVWHLYVIQAEKRNGIQKLLSDQGVGTLIHYPIPPHLQNAYLSSGFSANSFPIAGRLSERVLSTPIGPHLSQKQAIQVVKILNG